MTPKLRFASFQSNTIRSVLRSLAAATIVFSAAVNLWRSVSDLRYYPAPGKDDVSVWEDRLFGIRGALIRAHFRSGDIGFMPGGVLNGRPRTPLEHRNWAEASYVLIPLNLKQDSLDAPFVIVDFLGESDRQIPEGFTTVYEEPDGLVLLKREAR